MTNKLTVEQVDRDAGADLFLREQFTPLSAPHFRIAKDARAGKHDDWDCIQAFARHRQQAEARAETGWQDIATAPKDGTLIDVWRGGEFPRRVPDVSWREPTDSEWWVHGGDTIRTPAATWHDMFGPFGKDDTPTHWRPLPSPPAIRETPHAEG